MVTNSRLNLSFQKYYKDLKMTGYYRRALKIGEKAVSKLKFLLIQKYMDSNMLIEGKVIFGQI